MCTLCARFVWTTITARLSLLDKNIGTFARFYAYITEKSHAENFMYFLDSMGAAGRCKGVHVHPPLDSDLKFFLQRCVIAVIKINAGNARIKSHNTEVWNPPSQLQWDLVYSTASTHNRKKYWSYGPRLCTPCKKILRAPLLDSTLRHLYRYVIAHIMNDSTKNASPLFLSVRLSVCRSMQTLQNYCSELYGNWYEYVIWWNV